MARFPTCWVLALVPLSGGCAAPPPEPPRFDHSATERYVQAEFKDDAPANDSPADFPLAFVDAEGNPVDLTRYRGKRKVVLVVLRGVPLSEKGGLCPTCVTQAGSLMAHRQEFARRGAEVLVVFPGPADRLGEFMARARAQAGETDPGFHILLDQECAACTRLGIRDDLAKPSTYILDTRGKVVYAYVGETSTDRPSVKALLAQLDTAE